MKHVTVQTSFVLGHCEQGQTQRVRCRPERGTSCRPEVALQRAVEWPKGAIYERLGSLRPRLVVKTR